MQNKKIESCITACQKCVDTCETCSTENKGKAGMEHSEKLCIACTDACNALVSLIKKIVYPSLICFTVLVLCQYSAYSQAMQKFTEFSIPDFPLFSVEQVSHASAHV